MTNVLFVHVNMLLVHTHTQAFHVSPQGHACYLLVTSLNSMEETVLGSICHPGFGSLPLNSHYSGLLS